MNSSDNAQKNDPGQTDEHAKLRAEYDFEAKLLREIRDKEDEHVRLTKKYEKTMSGLMQQQKKYENLLNNKIWKVITPARKLIGISVRARNKARRMTSRPRRRIEKDPLKLLQAAKPGNIVALKREYARKNLSKTKDTFVLYRVIGNDLYPRHKKGQSRENLRFILENEPEHEDCEMRFVVNRIVDRNEERAIITLLKQHKKEYLHIPFDVNEYKEVGFDFSHLPEPGYFFERDFLSMEPESQSWAVTSVYRLKNNYVMNNNGARNAALRDGKKRAKWVLPWDGNCFVTPEAWNQIREDVKTQPYLKYFAVPMARVLSNDELLSGDKIPRPVEEPQLIFRSDSTEEFNEEFCYGRRPKVELFWRLGIPGPWDRWIDEPWDQKRRPKSKEAGQFGVAGWVARMFSGMKNLEQDDTSSKRLRGLARNDAITSTICNIEANLAEFSADDLTSIRASVLEKEAVDYKKGGKQLAKIVASLLHDAEGALARKPFSVVDKTTLAPSGDKQDYWHPAPYWWPNPDSPDGLPYVRRDGERAPGTNMYEPESDKYDRTRLQHVFDDSIALALAWKFTGKKKYAQHAVKILERFFVDPKTRMNPHLKYAQVRIGHNDDLGHKSGLIEMKDLYYYLDAVRILRQSGALQNGTLQEFKEWLSEYLGWVMESPQGKQESRSSNNHGTYYDLQVSAIAAFLDNRQILFDTLLMAQSRIPQQFETDGSQPEELSRTNTLHYCTFNAQGWMHLAEIASRVGIDFWKAGSQNKSGIGKGIRWLTSHSIQKWPFEQIDEFDLNRLAPIRFGAPEEFLSKAVVSHFPKSRHELPPKLHPHDGVRPYWNLGL